MIVVLAGVRNLNAQVLFDDITAESGIIFEGNSESVCVFDYDNDLWDDILFTSRYNGQIHLYRNEHNMNFTDVSNISGVDFFMDARTAVAGDYDNDGDLDLFIGAATGQSLFLENNGNGSFQNVTAITGINVDGQVRGCSWIDYNNDGNLDLYVGILSAPNKLYMNNGDRTFVDVAQNIGAAGPLNSGVVMGLGFIDFDRDGDQDLYIAQDNNLGNILLEYESFGQFIDVSAWTHTNVEVMAMGVAFGDINRDGYFDIYTTNLYENTLLLNSISGIFQNISAISGTQDISGSMGWGTFFFDANNDGWLDIYNNNETDFGNVPNSLFINNGDSTFQMLTTDCGAVLNNNGFGSANSDLDHDGDLDMVLAGHISAAGSIILMENLSPSNNWISFYLSQTNQNIYAVGATVELYQGENKQLNFIGAGNGYCSQNTLDVHFGLGNTSWVDSVRVYWPDGDIESFMVQSINQRYSLLKGSGTSVALSTRNEYLSNEFVILDVYPNPFNSMATIKFSLSGLTGNTVNIYNLTGEIVETLEFNRKITGTQLYHWNAGNRASGLYIIQLNSGGILINKKCLLIK